MLYSNVLMHVANRASGYLNILQKFADHSGQIGLSAVVAFELNHKLVRQKVSKAQIEALRRAVAGFPGFRLFPGSSTRGGGNSRDARSGRLAHQQSR
jgi:hypothetical protein